MRHKNCVIPLNKRFRDKKKNRHLPFIRTRFFLFFKHARCVVLTWPIRLQCLHRGRFDLSSFPTVSFSFFLFSYFLLLFFFGCCSSTFIPLLYSFPAFLSFKTFCTILCIRWDIKIAFLRRTS